MNLCGAAQGAAQRSVSISPDFAVAPGIAAQGIADSRACLTLGFVPALGGTYFARVEDVAGGSGAEFSYWLELR